MNAHDHILELRSALRRIKDKAREGILLDVDQLSALEDIEDISGDALELFGPTQRDDQE